MVNVNQDHQLQWRVTCEDGQAFSLHRFQEAWAYAIPNANEGWIYLPKVTAIHRFMANEKKICVAWRPNQQIFLEWF